MKPGERAQVVPVELVTEFGSFFFEATFVPTAHRKNYQFVQTGQPTPSSFRANAFGRVEDVRDFVAEEYKVFNPSPAVGPPGTMPHPTDDEIRETIRRGRRAVMPDPTERDKPKSKAELGRKLANGGKLCPGCNERCGPRTKICMCGHNFHPNGASQ